MDNNSNQCNRSETEATTPIQSGWVDKPVEGYETSIPTGRMSAYSLNHVRTIFGE